MRFSIADTIAARCFGYPDRTAIETTDGRGSFTYGEVWRRIAALSAAVSGVPAGKHGKMVGLLMPNGADAALAFAACQQARAIAVPVNGRLTLREMQHILSDSDCRLVLTGGRLAAAAREACERLAIPVLDTVEIETPNEAPRPAPDDRDIGAEPCVLGYTSGTTGFPKGAIYSHDYYTMNNYRWGWEFGLSSDNIILIAGPMCHLSYAGFALAGLTIGARVRIMPEFDASVALVELRQQCSFAFLVPSMLSMIAEQWKKEGRPPLESARHVLISGAPTPLKLMHTIMEMLPNARIAEMYGWTEGAFVAYEVKNRDTLVPQCVGWPALGADIVLFNEQGERCGIGEPGEVGVRSAVPFAGYLGNPQATEAAHYRGYVMSGDIGQWLPDGRLCIIDRKKDVIITGGENVYTIEVERVLLEHPDIADAAVVGVPDERWGEHIAAILVVRNGAVPDEASVLDHCRRHLAGYKIPRSIRFADAIPRNSMGKVQKFKVVEHLTAGTDTAAVHSRDGLFSTSS